MGTAIMASVFDTIDLQRVATAVVYNPAALGVEYDAGRMVKDHMHKPKDHDDSVSANLKVEMALEQVSLSRLFETWSGPRSTPSLRADTKEYLTKLPTVRKREDDGDDEDKDAVYKYGTDIIGSLLDDTVEPLRAALRECYQHLDEYIELLPTHADYYLRESHLKVAILALLSRDVHERRRKMEAPLPHIYSEYRIGAPRQRTSLHLSSPAATSSLESPHLGAGTPSSTVLEMEEDAEPEFASRRRRRIDIVIQHKDVTVLMELKHVPVRFLCCMLQNPQHLVPPSSTEEQQQQPAKPDLRVVPTLASCSGRAAVKKIIVSRSLSAQNAPTTASTRPATAAAVSSPSSPLPSPASPSTPAPSSTSTSMAAARQEWISRSDMRKQAIRVARLSMVDFGMERFFPFESDGSNKISTESISIQDYVKSIMEPGTGQLYRYLEELQDSGDKLLLGNPRGSSLKRDTNTPQRIHLVTLLLSGSNVYYQRRTHVYHHHDSVV